MSQEPSPESPIAAVPPQGVTRLLIVDSSRTVRRYLITLARRNGYVADEAEDAAGALAAVRGGRVDVLISGYELIDGSGIEMCWHFKSEQPERPSFAIVLTPANDARRAAEALDGGADDCLRLPVDASEFLARLRIAVRLLGLQRRLFAAAWTDALTGVWNRRRFLELGEREWLRGRRENRRASLIMVDIDFFKKINDTHGHEAGDVALVALANVFRRTLRPQDVLGRLGGEEFAVLMPDADTRTAMAMAERLRRTLEAEAVPLQPNPIRITASFGVSPLHPAEPNLTGALRRADQLVYVSKANGRNRVSGPDQLPNTV